MDRSLLEKKSLAELREIASTLALRGYQRLRKADIVSLIIEAGAGGEDTKTEAKDAPSMSAPAEKTERETPPARVRAPRARAEAADNDAESEPTLFGGSEPARESGSARRDVIRPPRPGGRGRHAADGGDDSSDTPRPEGRDRDAAAPTESRDDRPREDRARGERPRGQREDREQRGRRADSDRQPDADNDASERAKRDRRRKGRPGTGGQSDGLDGAEVREGVLDLLPEGYGFLRVTGYLAGDQDVYVSQSFVRRFDLRRGDRVSGPIRRNKNNDKFPALARVDAVEGRALEDGRPHQRAAFDDLTPLFPDEQLRLETGDNAPASARLIDLFAPIGKGQRGLIVSPPKSGKTAVLKQIAASVEANNPEAHLMVLLVDERPEEVTDFERSTSGEVISSTFDRPAEDHTQIAELALERAKRLVEWGQDVVVLLDSMTRLSRAYNLAVPATGRVLAGGIDSAALYPPKRFFGAARNIEGGGSLTILATALIETGSRMDEVIFEEFVDTGNMELRLDQGMAQKRIFPAVDIAASGTRREASLLDSDDLEAIWQLRRELADKDLDVALPLLLEKLGGTDSNEQFLKTASNLT